MLALDAMLKNCGQPYEIIAIDDGSTDGSRTVLTRLNVPALVVLQHVTNRGYGASLTAGLKHSRYGAVVITDADGTYPIERIPNLLKGNYTLSFNRTFCSIATTTSLVIMLPWGHDNICTESGSNGPA